MSAIPSRYGGLSAARKRHGDRVDRYLAFARSVDPVGDAAGAALAGMSRGSADAILSKAMRGGSAAIPRAPRAVRALFREVEHLPLWVREGDLENGGQAFLRTGLLGAIVLLCSSLPVSYASPGGVKPLIISGGLMRSASQRLHDTSRFMVATCLRGGLRPFAPGWVQTLRVRLLHSAVRRRCLASTTWNDEAWGAPVNQADLLGTSLMFSVVALQGLRRFGFRFAREESEAYVRLWRTSGFLLGVDPEMLPATEDDATQLLDLTLSVQKKPDADCRLLTRALIAASGEHDPSLSPMVAGVMRTLLGTKRADELAVPVNRWRFAVGAVNPVVRTLERARATTPFGTAWVTRAGVLAWSRALVAGPRGFPDEFRVLPQVRNLLAAALPRERSR